MTSRGAGQGRVSSAALSFTRETSRPGAPFSLPVYAIGEQGRFRQGRLQNRLGTAVPLGIPFLFEEKI
jgi:hypothetical protein